MPDSDSWRKNPISRRKAIQATALGGVGLLAGCGGGPTGETTAEDQDTDNGSGEDTDNGSGDETTEENGGGTDITVHDETFTELDRQGTPPNQRHFNPWNPSEEGCWFPGQAVFVSLAEYLPSSDENIPLIAKSWEMPESQLLEVELNDNFTWHNGDQFVAEDAATQYKIQKNLAEIQADEDDDGPASIYDSIEAVDDTFLRIEVTRDLSTLRTVMNSIGLHNGQHSYGIFTKHDDDQWSSWLESLEDASDDDADDIVEEITTTAEPKIENAIGNGPFKPAEIGDSEIVLERYEDFPNADQINFENYTYWVPSNTGETFQPVANEQVTASSKGFPVEDALMEQLPDNMELFRETLSSNKLFAFNMGHEVNESVVSNRHVRRALVHIFNREEVTKLLEGVNELYEWPSCRVPGSVMAEESHDAAKFVKENFELYGTGDTEKAADLLRGEGFEKDGDAWLTDEGEPFEIEILDPADRPDFQMWIQQMQDFGIDVTESNVDDATLDERRKEGDYDIIPDGSSANGVFAMWAEDLVINWLLETLLHGPDEYEIPMPIGDPEGSSGTKTISISDHISDWMSTDEDEYHQELMWWWNQYVPEHENMYRPDAGIFNKKNFEWNNTPDAVRNGSQNALTTAFKVDGSSIQYKG